MRLVPALAWLLVFSTSATTAPKLFARAGEPPESPKEMPAEAPASPPTPAETPTEGAIPTETPEAAPIRLPTELELKQEKARSLVKRGRELAAGRFNSEALAAFRAALAAWPAYPLAHYELALTLVDVKDLPGAEANLKAAIALAPDFARAHQALGEVYRRSKRPEEARTSYLEAVNLAPNDTVAWYGLATTLKGQKKDAEALWALESLLAVKDQNPDAPVAVEARKEAASLISKGVTAQAIEVKPPVVVEAPPETPPETPAETQPETPPENPDAVAISGTPGVLGRKEGDKAFAQRRYMEALRLYMSAWEELVPPPPKAPPAPQPKPEAKAETETRPAPGDTAGGDTVDAATPEPATPEAKPAGAPEPTPEAKPATPEAKPEPKPEADTKVEIEPEADKTPRGDPELAYRIGATYAVINDLKPAIRWWMTALSLAPERELIARHLGLLLRRVRSAEPTPTEISGAVRIERAKTLLREGDAASALMLVMGRDEVGAGHLEAESRLRLGDFAAARRIFEELLAADPEDRLANAGLGETLFRLGEEDLARKAINAWMGDEKSRPESFIVLRRGELEARLLAPYEPED